MKEIVLSRGKVALVDDEDFEEISKFKWSALKTPRSTFYAVRSISVKRKQKFIYMHRVINKTADGQDTDHIDGNSLNNQKSNLRTVTRRVNLQNLHCEKSSKYPGVCWHINKLKWMASIRIKGKSKYLGFFNLEEDAAAAYNKAVKALDVKDV